MANRFGDEQAQPAAAVNRFGDAAATATPPQPKSAMEHVVNFAKNFWGDLAQTGQGMVDMATTRPDKTVKGIGAAQDAVRVKAQDAIKRGDYVEAARHALHYLIPVAGPAIDARGDQAQAGDISGSLGGATSIGLQLAAPGALHANAAAIVPAVETAAVATKGAAQGAARAAISARTAGGAAAAEYAASHLGLPGGTGTALIAGPRIVSGAVRGARAALAERVAAATRALEAQAAESAAHPIVPGGPLRPPMAEPAPAPPVTAEVPPASAPRVPVRPPIGAQPVEQPPAAGTAADYAPRPVAPEAPPVPAPQPAPIEAPQPSAAPAAVEPPTMPLYHGSPNPGLTDLSRAESQGGMWGKGVYASTDPKQVGIYTAKGSKQGGVYTVDAAPKSVLDVGAQFIPEAQKAGIVSALESAGLPANDIKVASKPIDVWRAAGKAIGSDPQNPYYGDINALLNKAGIDAVKNDWEVVLTGDKYSVKPHTPPAAPAPLNPVTIGQRVLKSMGIEDASPKQGYDAFNELRGLAAKTGQPLEALYQKYTGEPLTGAQAPPEAPAIGSLSLDEFTKALNVRTNEPVATLSRPVMVPFEKIKASPRGLANVGEEHLSRVAQIKDPSPITVIPDGRGNFILDDGFHRYTLMQKNPPANVPVEIRFDPHASFDLRSPENVQRVFERYISPKPEPRPMSPKQGEAAMFRTKAMQAEVSPFVKPEDARSFYTESGEQASKQLRGEQKKALNADAKAKRFADAFHAEGITAEDVGNMSAEDAKAMTDGLIAKGLLKKGELPPNSSMPRLVKHLKDLEKAKKAAPATIGKVETKPITLYRGTGTPGQKGHFYTADQDFAREFTRSGLDSEIKSVAVDPSRILDMKESAPFAGDVEAMDAAIKQAKKQGADAFYVSEGEGQPRSVFFVDPRKAKATAK